MVKFKKILFLLLTFIGFLSCKKDLNSPFPYNGDKLVIFSTLTVGEPVSAEINQSYDPNKSTNFEPQIKNLIVILKENNIIFDTLYYINNYLYKGKKNVTEGNGYSIHVNDIVFGEIDSETIIPLKSKFEISFSNLGKYKSPLNSSVPTERIKVEINAETSANKIFKTSIFALFKGEKYFLTMTPVGRSTDVSDNCSKFLQDLSFTIKSECIDKTNSISYDVELQFYNPEVMKSITPDSLIIEVKEINNNYFEFLSNYDDSNFLENAFKIPGLMPGNFNNAYGFFHEISTKKIFLTKGFDYYK